MAKVILSGSRNIKKFNHSRYSYHKLVHALPIPLKKIFQSLDGVDMGLHFSTDYQVIHSFNRIPYTKKPWVVTFEDLLPRCMGAYSNSITEILRKRLLLENCKSIIPISEYAKKCFIRNSHKIGKDELENLINKIKVIHPNVIVKNFVPKSYNRNEQLNLVFIGNDFVRKGGLVVLRLAKEAEKRKLPIIFHLVSELNYGSQVYTDHPDTWRYEEDIKLLSLSNVVFHQKIENRKVIELLSTSHFQIMPTLHDTYGFSILEGFSVGTPTITTNICALPEIVHPDQNGYLLHLPVNEYNEFNCWGSCQPGSQEHWDFLDNTYNELAIQALNVLLNFLNKPEYYEELSTGAIAQANKVHDSKKTSKILDKIYSDIAT